MIHLCILSRIEEVGHNVKRFMSTNFDAGVETDCPSGISYYMYIGHFKCEPNASSFHWNGFKHSNVIRTIIECVLIVRNKVLINREIQRYEQKLVLFFFYESYIFFSFFLFFFPILKFYLL